MIRTLGAGIIGAGTIFRDHARAYSQLGERVRLVGLADVDEAKLRLAGHDYFIPFATTDYRALLARDDIDLVSICTPPSLHEEMVTAALDAGKYVVCEKPLAHTLAATDRIIERADHHPGKLGVVYQVRYSPEVQRTLWCRDEGLLGELSFGRFSRYGRLVPERQGQGWWGRWDVAGGGAVMTQCIHELDLILLVFGPARRVTARMATLGHKLESEDTFSATIEMETGAVVTCFCSLAGNVRFSTRWDVVGQHAAVHYPWSFDSLDRGLTRQVTGEVVKRFPSGSRGPRLPGIAGKVENRLKRKLGGHTATKSQHVPYLQAVANSVIRGTPLPVPHHEARASLELATAIYTSAILDESVSLPLAQDARLYSGVTIDDYDGRVLPASQMIQPA